MSGASPATTPEQNPNPATDFRREFHRPLRASARRYVGYLALIAAVADPGEEAPAVHAGRAVRGLPFDQALDARRLLARGVGAPRVRRELDLSPPAVAVLALGTRRAPTRTRVAA